MRLGKFSKNFESFWKNVQSFLKPRIGGKLLIVVRRGKRMLSAGCLEQMRISFAFMHSMN